MQRYPERDQLCPVGVEATREGFVRHLLVALDVSLDVPCRHRPPFRHQEGDERELPDQLVGVVRHAPETIACGLWKTCGLTGSGYAATRERVSRCWCDGQ